MADPIVELITTYNELNSTTVATLTTEPSPLQFLRYVARNEPFVVRGGAKGWPAARLWNAEFLKEQLKEHVVNVAVTPNGRADAPTATEDGSVVFAKPHEENQLFSEFIDYLIRQEKGELPPDAEVRYAQTQNDNFRDEYASLLTYVQKDIPFARIALSRDTEHDEQVAPDAINLWLGNSRSVTAMHKDNYENIYVQILGRKHFVLLPPLCHPCVNEKSLRAATYRRGDEGLLRLVLDELESDDMKVPSESEDGDSKVGNGTVPFALWDPDTPTMNATPYSEFARSTRVTLEPGDMLYLPAMWYHKVSQSCSDEGICVAANYWYDMEFSGPFYPLCSFVRSVHQQQIHKEAQGK